ncbi:MAG: PilW family protein, partial [Polyangiales bacterium]
MKRTRHNRRASKTAGFTLLELMVALVAGLIAISSIYFVSAASTRHFHEQQRIAQTQMSLR